MGRVGDTARWLAVKACESLRCVPTEGETLREEFVNVVARVESLRGRISAFEPRSPRGRRMGCLIVC